MTTLIDPISIGLRAVARVVRPADEWRPGRAGLLAAFSRELGIQYVSAGDAFCNDEGCLAGSGPDASQLMAFDPGHLTVPGSIFLTDRARDLAITSAVTLVLSRACNPGAA